MNSYCISKAKRAFDLAFSIPGLIVLSPLFLAVSLALYLDDRGPMFFIQERIGESGMAFRMYKFRTMVQNAELRGGQLTVGDDARITRVGRVLRKTKIDELPQLINVLRSEMSLVGPRPEVAKYVRLYSEDQRKVLQVIPGITDPASVKYRSESELLAGSSDPESMYVNVILPDKIRLNLDYAERASLASDFCLIFQTLLRLFSRS